ncbi:hypothetical protein FRC14_005723 [Serendipita sp. 396]|nr:hypothetical protein FRC14_005723 [Serendipita sp. 396]KAG8780093.1 hypothetical protein FRC15_009751 [Serendipita sp. 397]KAG8797047.1 hypothetical protein FRC16_009250 [Serendipita sp. 398]KAG8865615.1 hypothetical protein FRC20_009639 [Serendipita sp. 405]
MGDHANSWGPSLESPRNRSCLGGRRKIHQGKTDKDFVSKCVVLAVHTGLNEWYETVHAESGHCSKLGDIQASHSQCFNNDSGAPTAKDDRFGTARIDPGNAKPTHETTNPNDWLAICAPGYEDESNKPRGKANSQKSGQEDRGAAAAGGKGSALLTSTPTMSAFNYGIMQHRATCPISIAISQHSNTGGVGGDPGSVASNPASDCPFCGMKWKYPLW